MFFLLSVHSRDDQLGEFGAYESAEEMNAALEATNVFNNQLRAEGYWIFAGGLAAASLAKVISPEGEISEGPALDSDTHISGFWIVDVPSAEVADNIARAAAAACGGSVEVRPFHGN